MKKLVLCTIFTILILCSFLANAQVQICLGCTSVPTTTLTFVPSTQNGCTPATCMGFGSVTQGTPSTLSVAMNTSGANELNISIAISGANAADFSQSNNCGSQQIIGGSCSINIVAIPSALGSRVATLTVNGSATSGNTIALSVTGIAGASCPGSINKCAPSTYTAPLCNDAAGPNSAVCTNDTYTAWNTTPPAINTFFCDTDFVHTSDGGWNPLCHGTTEVRITDQANVGAAYAAATGQPSNVSFRTASGAPEMIISADNTRLVATVSAGNQNVFFSLDLANHNSAFLGSPGSQGAPMISAGSSQLHFSKTENKIAYGVVTSLPNANISQIDVTSTTPANWTVSQIVANLNAICNFTDQNGNPVTIAGNSNMGGWDASVDTNNDGHDRYLAAYFGPQNTAQWVVVVDRHTNPMGCVWYNAGNYTPTTGGTGQIAGGKIGGGLWNGVAAPTCNNCMAGMPGPGIGFHSAELFTTGNAILMTDLVCATAPNCSGPTANSAGINELVFWQPGTTTIAPSSVIQASGHRQQAINYSINGNNGADQWISARFDDINHEVDWGEMFSPTKPTDQHNGWHPNNSENNTMYATSFNLVSQVGSCINPTVPGQNEITGIEMTCKRSSCTTFPCTATCTQAPTHRFAHTFGDACLNAGTSGSFYNIPIMQQSLDGTIGCYATNWNGNLGTNNGGFFRTDIMCLEMR